MTYADGEKEKIEHAWTHLLGYLQGATVSQMPMLTVLVDELMVLYINAIHYVDHLYYEAKHEKRTSRSRPKTSGARR